MIDGEMFTNMSIFALPPSESYIILVNILESKDGVPPVDKVDITLFKA